MKLKDINYSVVLLGLMVAKALILGSTYSDAVVIAALSGLAGFMFHSNTKEERRMDEKTQVDIKSDLEKLRSTVDGLKMAASMRR